MHVTRLTIVCILLVMSHRINWSIFFTILTLLTPFLIKTNTKNACTSYFDYLLINFGGDCYHNPDVDLSVSDIIKKYAGDVKTYNVTTEDGYILTIFRIFRKNPVGVILMQPPISAGSVAYLSDHSDSIALALWEKGYDVWLSNHRGASYSRQHVNLSESDSEFWNFGFHEIALYDLDPQFQLISKETNSKIIYIGYSMASTEALIYGSLKPDRAKKYIDSFILMAPLATLKFFSSPFKYILGTIKPFKSVFRNGEFLTFEAARWLAQPFTITPYIVSVITPWVMGWTPNEMDPALYPYIFAHHGRGISNKMLYHYGQIFENGRYFTMYDYGKTINNLNYGSDTPPIYPLQNIRIPTYVIYGDKDKIATASDMKILFEELLPREAASGLYEIPNHNHIDFMFSRYRRKKTYQTIFTILDKINKRKIPK